MRLAATLVAALTALPIVAPCAVAAAPQPSAAASADTATTQLPRTVRPTTYEVAVVPDAAHRTFTGTTRIGIEVLQPTASITLNAVDMTFPRVALAREGGAASGFAAPTVTIDADAQTATFAFDHPIAPGRYELSMDYTGKIGTQANGLFAIDYDTRDGAKRALFTQFENSDARRFFPCWDEPSYKATFALSATIPATQMAVSNMPVEHRTGLAGGRALVRFATSPKMSTYLLFFALGDFERATATAEGVEIGVIAQKGTVSQAAFALDSAKDVLHEYNAYFGTPYPLPKLDNIASPGKSEFFSAMENWGAIFTFEYALLLDPAFSTPADRQHVFTTLAHETAHQWFGDLVTMGWWDDLWLNEGFASWLEGRTTEKLHPEWNTALDAVGVRERAMVRDALVTTHPVVQHIETVEQASQAFDAITYSKGESVIRMLEGYVGADAWRDGVRRYIKGHAYGNTRSDDLWRAVEQSAGKPVLAIAHAFTLQPGIPLIAFAQSACSGGATTLTFTQGEFTRDRPDKVPLRWPVPVVARVPGHPDARVLVDHDGTTLRIPGCGTVVVNAGQNGYFRTLYGPAQRAAIKAGFASLAPIDQIGIMDDTWALGMAGREPASAYLELSQAAPVDADPRVWSDIADILRSLDAYEDIASPQREALRRFGLARLRPVFARVGWTPRPGEPDPVANLRSDLIRVLSQLGDPAVVAEARRRYLSTDPADRPPAMAKSVLTVVGRHADAAMWDRLHAAARAEKTAQFKDNLYGLLASTEDEALARRALELALTDEPGATNSASMIGEVADLHPELAFDFAVAHREQVDAFVDGQSRAAYYPRLAANSADPAIIERIHAFADEHIAPTSRRGAETAIAQIRYRLDVRSKRLPEIDAWLARNAR